MGYVAELEPNALVAIRVTVNCPVAEYVCDGSCAVLMEPSPKAHAQLVGALVLKSVKWTGPWHVRSGEALKPATGGMVFCVTMAL